MCARNVDFQRQITITSEKAKGSLFLCGESFLQKHKLISCIISFFQS